MLRQWVRLMNSNMINKFVVAGASLALVFCLSGTAWAQNCDSPRDMILNMKPAEIGSYSVWDTVFGEKDIEEGFKSGILLESGHVLAVGERYGKGGASVELIMSEVKRNGRPAWRQVQAVSGLEGVVKALEHPKGMMILGTRHTEKGHKVLWLGVFDLKGALVSQTDIVARGQDLEANDFAASLDGTAYLVAASAQKRGLAPLSSAMIYKVNVDGKLISDRSIVTGYENAILGLKALPSGGVLGTGYMVLDDGRKGGWIVRFDGDGNIQWQNQYPRGAGAKIQAGLAYGDQNLLVVGTALPAGRNGNRSAWAMVVDAFSGRVGWQRYYASPDLGYIGRDILANDDGLISVLIDGDMPIDVKPGEDGADTVLREHVRVLTLNPRGMVFSNDAYFNGVAVDAHQMLFGPNKERILIGASDVEYVIEDPEAAEGVEPEKVLTQEVWLTAATASDPYDDPCVQAVRVLP